MTPSSILRIIKAMIARRSIKDLILKSNPLQIIIGAGGTSHNSWISTDYPLLDITNERSWLRLVTPETIDALLAEHVFEHLSDSQVEVALTNSFKFLRRGGYLRIAVPDGFHPNCEYLEMVKPGGCGEGAKDHQQLFNYISLSDFLEKTGFTVRLLEWFDESGSFHFHQWKTDDGFIKRSSRFDERNFHTSLSYTSLIVDACKI